MTIEPPRETDVGVLGTRRRHDQAPATPLGLHMLGPIRARAISAAGFRSLQDLLDDASVLAARRLVAWAIGGVPGGLWMDLVIDDYRDGDVRKAAHWPVAALRGSSDDRCRALASIGVSTIGDLEGLAREVDAAILAASQDNGFSERPSAPAELLPGQIGSVASSVRLTTFVRNIELRKLILSVGNECVVELPLSPLAKHPGSLSEIFTNLRCPVVHLGFLCGHRQSWQNLGTHLGEVVHSIALGPGESRNIALVNWRRRQLTTLEEKTTGREQLTATFIQNRALEEITTAVAKEHQEGETQTEAGTSVTAGSFVAAGAITGGIAGALIGTIAEPGAGSLIGAVVGGTAGAAAGGLIFSGSKALGMVEAETDGDRDIIADVHQRISLSTSQTASAVRSLWSTVVVEDAQAESVEATTSNITNYNHMHSLNLEYFEVLQVAVQPWWRDYAAAAMSGVRAGGSHAPVVNRRVIASRVSRPHLVAVDR